MEYFVDEGSVVRRIWAKSDTILFIFAGAAAEFAVNKAVDWLYFTGRLPADPLGRLFSTVKYAQAIVFSERKSALKAIDTMTAIHAGVEEKRGARIPDWAYRDVLFMLIDYSIRSYELLERKLTLAEKQEVFDVFNRVGNRMGINGLPTNFGQWLTMRESHLEKDLHHSHFTVDLFRQYRKHLGAVRYAILLNAQKLVVPERVASQLQLGRWSIFRVVVWFYKAARSLHLDGILRRLILPAKHRVQILGLDQLTSTSDQSSEKESLR